MDMTVKQRKIYDEVVSIYPEDDKNPKLRYVNKRWIFPNHIDIVIDSALKFVEEYYPEANREIVFLAALLHDTGLVYERTEDDSAGHEERSIKYATEILQKYNYSKDFISKVTQAISATEPENTASSIESKIVRTADAYSHFISIHFFAKSNFTEEWDRFIKWFARKIDSTYMKLELEEVKKEIEPIYNHYKNAIDMYFTRNN